ncbi:MAG: MlaD family protein, partial [Gammaproteobacteria bacterium]|nr:MlaD family protein [Gammaproteobacteria bacterium]
MAAPDEPAIPEDISEAVVDAEKKGFPVVWLLPLVAVLIGGWLIYKTISEKGPEIVISFKTADGIEANKTQLKYRDVNVGKVDNVTFSEDLSDVLVTATMAADADRYLTENTRFWVVRPRIGAGEVSGLGTLLSGAYIAMEPSEQGKLSKRFVGLEKPPVVTTDKQGTSYRLMANKLGSLSIGSPVYFRQFDVGEISEYRLADDHSHVEIGFFVQAPHDQYIQEGTTFWNAGGVSLEMSASGVQFEMESLASLISGGIAFETLPEHADSPRAPADTLFTLYDNHRESMERPITVTHTFVTRFSGSVRGLSVGAPVEFRGIRMGTVKSIELGRDPRGQTRTIPVVLIDLEPQRLEAFTDINATEASRHGREEFEQHTVKNIENAIREDGFRARLQSGNLVTGQLYVDLDYFPGAEPVELVRYGKYPEIPTLPNPLEGILIGFNKIIDKLEAARLEDTLENLNELMVSSNHLISTLGQNAPAIAAELQATLEEAHATLASLKAVTSTDGEI